MVLEWFGQRRMLDPRSADVGNARGQALYLWSGGDQSKDDMGRIDSVVPRLSGFGFWWWVIERLVG